MTSNPIVRKITFTGSTEIGKKLMEQCAGTLKKLSLELGGNAPFIVFDDADLDVAVQGAMASKYRNTGQTCVCANRLLVQDGVYDAFVAKLVEAVRKLRVGDGLAGPTEQGPLIDDKAVAKVEEHVADALAKGGKVALGGRRHALGGTFFEPTIITDVRPTMMVAREETFGPVAPVFSFKDEQEAIRMANDTEFGLASYFYTRDLARGLRVAERLEYGIVGLNTGLISTEVAPFGGVKESGIRPRGLEVRHPRLHRDEVPLHRRHRGLNQRALVVLLAIIVTIASVSTNIYIPALPAVRDYFDASIAEAQTTFSVALLTFAIGMLVWGPVADRYGRRAAILGGVGLMGAGALACLLAPSLGALVFGRGLLAFGTATGIAVARTVVSDLYPERMAKVLAQLAIVAVVASASAPVVGGLLTSWLGWRAVFGAQILMAAGVALAHVALPAGDPAGRDRAAGGARDGARRARPGAPAAVPELRAAVVGRVLDVRGVHLARALRHGDVDGPLGDRVRPVLSADLARLRARATGPSAGSRHAASTG